MACGGCCGRYFDWDKYLAALAHGDKKRKKERLGYDEDVFEKVRRPIHTPYATPHMPPPRRA